MPAPEPGEINQAIERVFKGAVTIETKRNPYFLVGDFNGDFSQDLAVVVKPVLSKLPDINDELANWILVDPILLAKGVPYPKIHDEMLRRGRVRVNEGDNLLAVVHGFQSQGWRDPQATQTYVLRRAAGDKMRTMARKQVVWAGNEKMLPRIWGDVIGETIGDLSGFLYYNGAKYAWYDPRTYKPGPDRRSPHSGASQAMR